LFNLHARFEDLTFTSSKDMKEEPQFKSQGDLEVNGVTHARSSTTSLTDKVHIIELPLH